MIEIVELEIIKKELHRQYTPHGVRVTARNSGAGHRQNMAVRFVFTVEEQSQIDELLEVDTVLMQFTPGLAGKRILEAVANDEPFADEGIPLRPAAKYFALMAVQTISVNSYHSGDGPTEIGLGWKAGPTIRPVVINELTLFIKDPRQLETFGRLFADAALALIVEPTEEKEEA